MSKMILGFMAQVLTVMYTISRVLIESTNLLR